MHDKEEEKRERESIYLRREGKIKRKMEGDRQVNGRENRMTRRKKKRRKNRKKTK